MADPHVLVSTSEEANAGIWDANLELAFHRDEGRFPNNFLHFPRFVSVGGGRWFLVTEQGYPYRMISQPPADLSNRMPLGLECALRSVFGDRIELGDWYSVRREILRDSGRAPADSAS